MDPLNSTPEKEDLNPNQIESEIKKEQETVSEEVENTTSVEEPVSEIETEIILDTEISEEPKPEADKKDESVTEPKPEAEIKSETGTVEEKSVVDKSIELDDDIQMVDGDEEGEDELDENSNGVMVISELSKQELCNRLKSLIEVEDILKVKNDVEAIKHAFYKKSKAESDQQRLEYLESGGDEVDFIPNPTELETEFKELYDEYKNRKAKYAAQLEKKKENNLLKKNHIIEQIKQLIDSKEDVSANISVFRQLQQDWKVTGPVPAAAANELWKQYNQNQEAFWDLIKINNELREYDFKKNLEAKTKLVEIAESLDAEEDVVSAFRQLQKLHEDWHDLGPVARELREEIWAKFKAASTVINKKHQSHFEGVRELEQENLEKKEALCEKIESVDTSNLSSYKDWDEVTKSVLEMQEEWRQIGFAPRKVNQKVFERYRKACDVFFSAKSDFYKEIKANLNENLEKKKVLCEKAEALKESTDWKETTEVFIQLQKEWKNIGPTPRKSSDDIWKRFIAACDYFFEQRNKNVGSKRSEETQNLVKKKELIERIKLFEKSENPSESLASLRALAAEWNNIGHVPFKEKDKIYKEYRTALDTQFDGLNIDVSQRRMESFKSNLKDMTQKGENKLYRERDKLVRAYERLKNEISTYENNIGFLSASSKKGGGMIQEMERKVEALRDEVKLLEKKIEMIDENI